MKLLNAHRVIPHALLTLVLVLLQCLTAGSALAADEVVYFHNDALGSPVAATDQAGNVLWQEEYEPFGDRLLDEAASKNNAMWYTGKLEEAELGGLQYFGARWYHSDAGRFMGMDPVGVDAANPVSYNRYAYANNNPYSYIDPDGRSAITKLVKLAVNGGDVAATFADLTQDAAVLFNPAAPPTSRLLAAISIASEAAPVSLGDAKDAYRLLQKATKKGTLPDSVFSSKAPKQTTPGTKTLEGQHINDQGRVEPWKAHYDDHGRQIGRTDYNAGNKAQDIPSTHHHTKEYNAEFPVGRSTGDHIPGEYKL